MLKAIDHVNIVTADLEKMSAFYRDILGWKITKRAVISGEWIGRIVGLPSPEAELVTIEGTAPPRLELLCYRRPATDGIPLISEPANAFGIRHLAFKVDDMDTVVEKLRKAGVQFFSEPVRVPDSQVKYSGGVRKRLVYFRDPEGNILELCEYR